MKIGDYIELEKVQPGHVFEDITGNLYLKTRHKNQCYVALSSGVQYSCFSQQKIFIYRGKLLKLIEELRIVKIALWNGIVKTPQPDHICGSPDSCCDQLCDDYFKDCMEVARLLKQARVGEIDE